MSSRRLGDKESARRGTLRGYFVIEVSSPTGTTRTIAAGGERERALMQAERRDTTRPHSTRRRTSTERARRARSRIGCSLLPRAARRTARCGGRGRESGYVDIYIYMCGDWGSEYARRRAESRVVSFSRCACVMLDIIYVYVYIYSVAI